MQSTDKTTGGGKPPLNPLEAEMQRRLARRSTDYGQLCLDTQGDLFDRLCAPLPLFAPPAPRVQP